MKGVWQCRKPVFKCLIYTLVSRCMLIAGFAAIQWWQKVLQGAAWGSGLYAYCAQMCEWQHASDRYHRLLGELVSVTVITSPGRVVGKWFWWRLCLFVVSNSEYVVNGRVICGQSVGRRKDMDISFTRCQKMKWFPVLYRFFCCLMLVLVIVTVSL